MRARALAILVLAVIALRVPLWSLPGLGRDEATYVLWAHHPQPAYAPLLQALLAIGRAFGAEAAWMWRVPSMIAGAVVLVLFDRWLLACGASASARWLALAALAFSPWQTYAGSILHPDDLQLLGILAFAWAARRGHACLALLAAALSPWAKPSGLLVTILGVAWYLQIETVPRRRALACTIVMATGLLPFVFAHPGMFEAMATFAHVPEHTSIARRLVLLLLGVTFLAGPAMLLRVLVRTWSVPRLDLQRAPEHVLAALLLAGFVWAAFATGQVKGNWLLPGLLLTWPIATGRVRARWNFAVAMSVLLSAAFGLVLARPDLARWAEERWGDRVLPAYLEVAGTREAEVASATRWWHRPAEYRSLHAWCARIDDTGEVPAVVSDDYGLAAQWAVTCPTRVPALVLPHDPMMAPPDATPAGALVLAVRCSIEDLVGAEGWREIASIPHPITGTPVRRALLVTALPLVPAASTNPTRSP